MNHVRLAVAGDLDVVMALLRGYLDESHRLGHTDILPTDRTLGWYAGLFGDYLSGNLAGACAVLDTPKGIRGFSLAGETPAGLPWDSDLGRRAYGWGTWVRADWRGQGWGTQLSLAVQGHLRDRGVEVLIGDCSVKQRQDELHRIGFTPARVVGIRRL